MARRILTSATIGAALVLISLLFFQNCGSAGFQRGSDDSDSDNSEDNFVAAVPTEPNPGTVPYDPNDPINSVKTIFNVDVRPIVENKCIRCHQVGAIGANFAMKSARSIALREVGVNDQVNSRTVSLHINSTDSNVPPLMPPFDAFSSSDCVNPEFKNNYGLNDLDRKVLNYWLDLAGAYAGQLRSSVSPISKALESLKFAEPVVDQLNPNDPSVKLLTAKNFNFETDFLTTPDTDGSHCPSMSDCYIRTVGITFGNTSEVFLTAFQVVPENPTLVHHVVLYEEGNMGKTYIVWAPGVDVERLPENSGIRIPANTRFTLDVHYNSLNAKGLADRSTVIRGKLASSVAKPLDLHMYGITGGGSLTINGNSEVIVNRLTSSQPQSLVVVAPFNGKIFGVFPHMHKYGTKINVKLKKADGSTQCLTNIPRWRFAWQLNYFPKDPIVFQKDDEIELECRYKNISSGTKTINFGENSDDEMCLGVLMYQQTN